jgi:hypothetical protein
MDSGETDQKRFDVDLISKKEREDDFDVRKSS